jgi:hypothetical protein
MIKKLLSSPATDSRRLPALISGSDVHHNSSVVTGLPTKKSYANASLDFLANFSGDRSPTPSNGGYLEITEGH